MSSQVDDIQPFIDDTILFSQIVDDTPNILKQLVQLSPVLLSLGLPTFPEEEDSISDFLQASFDIVHAFLRLQQQEVKSHERFEEEIAKLKADIDALQRKNSRQNDELQAREKFIGQQENQIALKVRDMKGQIDKNSFEKDELQKGNFKLQQKITQIQVELRKKENEIGKLKEQIKRVDKHQIYRNAYDISDKLLAQKKNESICQSGWESWVEVRHKLVEENYRQKEVIENLMNTMQQFFREIQEHLKVEGLFDDFNINRIQLPKGAEGLTEYTKEQLQMLNKVILSLSEGNKIEWKQFKEKNKSEKSSRQLKPFLNKENRAGSFKQQKKLNLSLLKPNNSIQDVDLGLSLISRISLNDVPDVDEISKDFKEEKQCRVDLKKWDLVFKQ